MGESLVCLVLTASRLSLIIEDGNWPHCDSLDLATCASHHLHRVRGTPRPQAVHRAFGTAIDQPSACGSWFGIGVAADLHRHPGVLIEDLRNILESLLALTGEYNAATSEVYPGFGECTNDLVVSILLCFPPLAFVGWRLLFGDWASCTDSCLRPCRECRLGERRCRWDSARGLTPQHTTDLMRLCPCSLVCSIVLVGLLESCSVVCLGLAEAFVLRLGCDLDLLGQRFSRLLVSALCLNPGGHGGLVGSPGRSVRGVREECVAVAFLQGAESALAKHDLCLAGFCLLLNGNLQGGGHGSGDVFFCGFVEILTVLEGLTCAGHRFD